MFNLLVMHLFFQLFSIKNKPQCIFNVDVHFSLIFQKSQNCPLTNESAYMTDQIPNVYRIPLYQDLTSGIQRVPPRTRRKKTKICCCFSSLGCKEYGDFEESMYCNLKEGFLYILELIIHLNTCYMLRLGC